MGTIPTNTFSASQTACAYSSGVKVPHSTIR